MSTESRPVPCRAVKPWTWARVLRDQGPRSRDFKCAMWALRTWMNDDGYAYPSLRTWAAGACMSVNTLTKHYRTALREGWLAIEKNHEGGQSWKKNVYRAAIPNHIQLPEKDELLSDALISVFGDIDESCVTQSDTPSALNRETCVTHADTPSAPHNEAVSPIADTPRAASEEFPGEFTEFDERCVKPGGEGVSKNGEGVSNYPPTCVKAVSVKSRNPLSPLETPPEALEALEALEVSKNEGAALARNTTVGNGLKNPPKKVELTGQARLDAARELARASDMEAAIKQYKLTEAEVEQIRRQHGT